VQWYMRRLGPVWSDGDRCGTYKNPRQISVDGALYYRMNSRFWIILLVIVLGLHPGLASAAAKHGDNSVPQQVFDGMRESFAANRAVGLHARYQFDLSGPNGGLWWIEINDGKCKIGRGRIQNPGVTFYTTDHDWVALSNGTLPGFWAYLTGRLKIRGDQKLAHRLDELFNY
jgi:putative sterol carrier protein